MCKGKTSSQITIGLYYNDISYFSNSYKKSRSKLVRLLLSATFAPVAMFDGKDRSKTVIIFNSKDTFYSVIPTLIVVVSYYVCYYQQLLAWLQCLMEKYCVQPFTVKQRCVLNECISNNGNFSFRGIRFLYQIKSRGKRANHWRNRKRTHYS